MSINNEFSQLEDKIKMRKSKPKKKTNARKYIATQKFNKEVNTKNF